MSNNLEHSQAKQQWLKQRLQNLNKKPSSSEIPRQPRDHALPLSFAQQRLWFLDQWEPGNLAYHLPYAWRFRGSLNRTALETSLKDMMARHESLRTTFTVIEGQPVQVIAPSGHYSLSIVDLSEVAAPDRDVEVTRLIQETASQPFDLNAGPLWRTAILNLEEDEHLFLLTLHHIITDGWSMGIFWRELITFYTAHANGGLPELPSLPIQYADFAVWQRQWFQGDVLEQQLNYWRRQLADAPPSLDLPTDAPRPSQQSYRGASQSFTFTPTLTQALKALSQQEGTTLFMTLLAVFQIFLARYTGQLDVLVGSPIAGRTKNEMEGLIGFFVNTLVLRIRLARQLTFREVLQQVRETCLDAYAHQDLPFEKLVEALQPVRDPSRHPIFQVLFHLQLADPTSRLTLPALQVEPIGGISQTAKFDLALSLLATPESMRGSFSFNTDLFSDVTMARLVTHFQTLLEGLVADPEQPVMQVPFLTQAERHQVLEEWNPPISEIESGSCVHDLFEVQVARTPEAVAIVAEDEHLTYGALNQRANQLAHYLRRCGICPEVRVGLCLERSLDLIMALLGILKAGGAYVPLDTAYPTERLSFMLNDSGIDVVLTHAPLEKKLPAFQGQVILLDLDWPKISHEIKTPPVSGATPENLAYVIYTSGSTGIPKGTSIRQRSVVQLVMDTTYIDLTPTEIFLQLAPTSFDASTFEVWGSLLNGAKLVIFPPHPPSLEELGHVIEAEGVTTLWLTAGLFQQMVEHQLDRLKCVHQLLAGGDRLSRVHVERVLAKLGTGRLINGYGPTENTTFTCCHVMTRGSAIGSKVPIGKPMANNQVYVLDVQWQPAPVGVVGELYVGGEGLARDYVQRPELTAEKFVPHPFSPDEGTRLYKTGDLARFRSDGTLEFLGRKDGQIKLRGFRIELGEIETVLTRFPAVQNAIVLCREDQPGEKRLVAYLVATPETALDSTPLREFLKTRLPDYMVPAAFVILDGFPLTLNGKVDRARLPKPANQIPGKRRDTHPTLTVLEHQLVAIWEQNLGISGVGVHDNFFELGGHSLMAANIFFQIEKIFHRKLPLSVLFQSPTIHGLANTLVDRGWSPRWISLIPIQPCGTLFPIFAVPGVGGNVICFSALSHFLGPAQPFYGFQSQGLDGKTKPFTTIEEMATHYIREMKTVQPSGPYCLGGACIGGVIAYEMSQQLFAQGEDVAILALMETWPPPQQRIFAGGLFVPQLRAPFIKYVYPLYYSLKRVVFQYRAKPNFLEFGKWILGKFYSVIKLFRDKEAYDHERTILHEDQVSSANRFALSQYVPREYPGRVVHFLAEERKISLGGDRRKVWKHLVQGKYETVTLKGQTSGELLKPPAVQELALFLKELLKSHQPTP